MSKAIVRVEGEAWSTLATELDRLRALVAGPEVDMHALGKGLASLMLAARGVFTLAGMTSVRMDAAVKALDLRTAKSELEQFARPMR